MTEETANLNEENTEKTPETQEKKEDKDNIIFIGINYKNILFLLNERRER